MKRVGLGVFLALFVWIGAACDNEGQRGCANDADCRSDRICLAGACVDPDNDEEEDDNNGDSSDAPSVSDGPSMDPPVTEPEDPALGRDLCARAREAAESCPWELENPENFYDLIPESCRDLDSIGSLETFCAAACTTELSCDELGCVFGGLRCVSDAWNQCMQNCAGTSEPEPIRTCVADRECSAYIDECSCSWVCEPVWSDPEPVTCDVVCEDPGPEPSCGCERSLGLCLQE